MIKKTILIVSLFILMKSGYSQTAEQWQADLRQLQNLVHSKYSNLFFNITAVQWDKAVAKFHTAIPAMSNTQVLVGFITLIAKFNVGHTQLNTFGLHGHGRSANDLTLHRYPFYLYWFSDGLYILKASNKYAGAVGGKITRIGNMKTEDALEAIRPLVSYENEQGFKSNGVYFLAIPEFLQAQGITSSADEVAIVYQKNGKEQTSTFKAEPLISLSAVSLKPHRDGQTQRQQVIFLCGKKTRHRFVTWNIRLQIKRFMSGIVLL